MIGNVLPQFNFTNVGTTPAPSTGGCAILPVADAPAPGAAPALHPEILPGGCVKPPVGIGYHNCWDPRTWTSPAAVAATYRA